MTEITNLENQEILSEKEYWKQLDLLFEAYKLQEPQEKLKKRLTELRKGLKKNFSNQNIQQFKALQILVKELAQKKEQIYSEILDSFNIFKMREQVSNLRGYLTELKKAFKKKKIDVNTYRITNDHYKKELNIHLKNLDRLNLLAKEYILVLKNEEIEVKSKYYYTNSRKSKIQLLGKRSRNNNLDYKNKKIEIKKKIDFLTDRITNSY